jgi:hypothetical protein
MTALAPPKEFI